MKGALLFRILTEISSYPLEFFGFENLIMFSVYLLELWLILILGKGVMNA
jgi:hypothetical protein